MPSHRQMPARPCAQLMDTQHVDVVILDIRMPGEDGLSLARYLREHFDVAIIMLTGSSEIIDRVIGLEIGADDYIAKPVDLRELLARVKAVLRRTSARGRIGEKTDAQQRSSLQFGNCRFFPETHKLFNAGGRRDRDHADGVPAPEGVRRASRPRTQSRPAARACP